MPNIVTHATVSAQRSNKVNHVSIDWTHNLTTRLIRTVWSRHDGLKQPFSHWNPYEDAQPQASFLVQAFLHLNMACLPWYHAST